MAPTLAMRIMKSAIDAGLTSREQLEEMRDRVTERMQNRRRTISDLHEMIASFECEANGITDTEALQIIAMMTSFCDMDEDRIEVLTDLLAR